MSILAQKSQEKSEKDRTRLQKVWKHAHRKSNEHKYARNGDHLMVPFECDRCIFWKLKCPRFIPGNYQDEMLSDCICQANLNDFWSRASSTVNRNK